MARRPTSAPRRLILLCLVGAALALLGLAVPAGAQAATVDQVASALRSDPVYNDPAAELTLTPGQVNDLRNQVKASNVPMYIAVLPQSMASTAGGPDQLLSQLRNAVGLSGVYAIVAGSSMRAGSTSGSVRGIADEAFQSQKANGVYAVLSTFVDLADQQYSSGNTPAKAGSSSGGGVGGYILLAILVLILGGLGALIFFGVRKSKKAKALQMQKVTAVLDEDVTALGEKLAAFDITDPRLDEAGRLQLQAALDSYSRASDLSARAASEQDITAATSALEDGRYALACVQARLDGKPEPQRRPPCFVDPRHGPSTSDVMWAPDGGQPHPVPVCDACAMALTSGTSPQPREVESGGRMVPYWQAGPAYAPYARGYYSSFGDMLPMLFMGTMMASAFSHPTVIVDNGAQSMGLGGGNWGGGGGFGGGDFGGGGFGGGDFGGGDFGGGDFGS